jgi:tRNA splicing ligase
MYAHLPSLLALWFSFLVALVPVADLCHAAGKSTAAKKLAASGWARVNQDEMGTRRVCEQRMEEALKKGQSVVVDRCNFDFTQRHTWVQLASKHGVGRIEAVVFDTAADICKQRVTDREDHPTIPKGGAGVAIVEKFKDLMVLPRKSEGFISIARLTTIEQSDTFCAEHALTPAPAAMQP